MSRPSTVAADHTAAAPPPEARRATPTGRIMFGVLLVLLGLAWLAETAGVLQIRWQTALAVAVMAVGAVLLAVARREHADGLIGLGVVLSVVLFVVSIFPGIALSPTAGERQYRPVEAGELQDRYELGAGQLLLDLSGLQLPEGTTRVAVSVGMGELLVRLPEGAAAGIDASAGAGELVLLGRTSSGIGPRLSASAPGSPGAGALELELSVGLGKVEVTQ